MRSLAAERLLGVWERGQCESAPLRALSLLEAACPEATREDLARLPIGTRDLSLIQLRELTFGTRLACVSSCPQCEEKVELEFETRDIQTGVEAPAAFVDGAVRFRVPNTLDLIAACEAGGVDAGRRVLLERCVEGSDGLPETALAAVVAEMEKADPQARIELAVHCPGCGFAWAELFDIVPYFWREIDVWAKRIFREIHTLASAYGWSERDILAMSAWRRQLYTEMAGV